MRMDLYEHHIYPIAVLQMFEAFTNLYAHNTHKAEELGINFSKGKKSYLEKFLQVCFTLSRPVTNCDF